MKISGATGYTLLQKNNKKVLIFSDIHDGVQYCQDTSLEIDDYFKNHLGNNQVLIEEAVHDDKIQLQDLWPNARHTQRLKRLVLDNKNTIIPIDIRPLLVPYSWELIESNEMYGRFRYINYIKYILQLLNKQGSIYDKYILVIIEDLNDVDRINIMAHFDEIIEFFKDNLMKYKDEEMIYIYNHNIEFLEMFNSFISMIMEWYIILLIFKSKNNSLLHAGLAHTVKVVEILQKVYEYDIIYTNGINTFKEIPSFNPSACIYVPDKII
jgi:hypothetical protein